MCKICLFQYCYRNFKEIENESSRCLDEEVHTHASEILCFSSHILHFFFQIHTLKLTAVKVFVSHSCSGKGLEDYSFFNLQSV